MKRGLVVYLTQSSISGHRVQCDARCLSPPSWKSSECIKGKKDLTKWFRLSASFLVSSFCSTVCSFPDGDSVAVMEKRDARAAKIPCGCIIRTVTCSRFLMKYLLLQRYSKFLANRPITRKHSSATSKDLIYLRIMIIRRAALLKMIRIIIILFNSVIWPSW